MRTLRSMGLAMGLCIAVAASAFGCSATVTPLPGDYPVAYADTVPPGITAYPHTYYAGGNVYYVRGRWYRSTSRGWVYYRHTPPELRGYRF